VCVRGFLLLFAAGALAAASPVAASVEQAQDRLFTLIGELRQRFPSLRDRTEYGIGTLEEGETELYVERFEAGTTYLVVAVGCESARDLDVGIVDASGKVMTADTDADAAAAVVFEPTQSGRYVVAVNMAKTTAGDAAHFAYQVFYAGAEK
jgi:hypothetical protein